jgi:hypothetical protein
MIERVNQKRQAWGIAILSSLIVHTLFCFALLRDAPPNNGLMAFFFPQIMLMYFMPPSDPFSYPATGVMTIDWLRFSGKMVTTYPASLAYGLVFGGIYFGIVQRRRT